MDSIDDARADVLRTVRAPGDFCIAGNCPIHVPLIEVDDVGPIALPLPSDLDDPQRLGA